MIDMEETRATRQVAKPTTSPLALTGPDRRRAAHLRGRPRRRHRTPRSRLHRRHHRESTTEPTSAPTETPAPTGPTGPADAEPQIAIDDFIKVELRVAQILVAERIPKADKLLRLEVDLGYEKRQILSGIAQWYTPEELIGRRIAIVANLAPRKMRGLESHGMLLAASAGHDDKPILASFSDEIALGSRVR